jgi:hypothetical protein
MSIRQSRAIAGAVALFAFAAVVLDVALVRMYCALLGQHFGLLWVTVFPLGVAIGAFIHTSFAPRPSATLRVASVAHLAALAAPCAAISVIFGIRAKGVDNFDAASIQQLLLFLGTSLLPFVFAGLVFSSVFGGSQRHSAGILRTTLAAAACGIVASAFSLRFGPARVGLGVAVVISLSAALFARASRFDTARPPASTSLVATFILGMSVVLAGEIGAPYLKLASLRWSGIDKAETQIWALNGFYTVDKPQSNSALLRIDGTFGRYIPDGKQIPPLAVDEMPYLLDKGQDPVLIVGAGGGREIRAALRQGQLDVHAVEEDVNVARAIMRGASYEFSEGLYDKPEVHVSIGGVKTYARTHVDSFQRIILGYYDSQAASPSGALAARPTFALTTDLIQDLLGALRPSGTITVMRPDPELDRLLVLVAHALRARGSRAPSMHMFGCARDKLSTVLVKRTPLLADELSTLRTHCRRHKFTEIISPDALRDESRKALMVGGDSSKLTSGQSSDLSAPTEDRPFWFYALPSNRLISTLGDIRGLIDRNRTLLVLVGGTLLASLVGLVAWFFSLVVPAQAWGYQTRPPVLRTSLTLSWVAVAIVLFGKAFMGRMEPIVGRPDVVALLFPLAFLFALSLGAGFANRFDEDDTRAGLQRWLLATTFVLAPLFMAFDGLLSVVVGLTFAARVLIPVFILGVLGATLGVGLGLAIRIAVSWGPRAFAYSLGQAGIGATLAILLGTLVAMNFGYPAELFASAFAMILAVAFAASAHIKSVSIPAQYQPLSSSDTALDDEPVIGDDSAGHDSAMASSTSPI